MAVAENIESVLPSTMNGSSGFGKRPHLEIKKPSKRLLEKAETLILRIVMDGPHATGQRPRVIPRPSPC